MEEHEESQITEPERLTSFDHSFGDVNELQFLTTDVFASASSNGTVSLLRIARENNLGSSGISLVQANQWKDLHKTKLVCSSCNGLSCSGDHIMTAGSDGKIVLLNAKRNSPVRVILSNDSCSFSACLFLKQDEAVAGNNRGQIKLWDLRSADETPSRTCNLSIDIFGATCIAKHPTQPHVLVAGGTDGSIAFWDLRGNQNYPLSVVKAHSGAVSEVSKIRTTRVSTPIKLFSSCRYIFTSNSPTTFSPAPKAETCGIGMEVELPRAPMW